MRDFVCECERDREREMQMQDETQEIEVDYRVLDDNDEILFLVFVGE